MRVPTPCIAQPHSGIEVNGILREIRVHHRVRDLATLVPKTLLFTTSASEPYGICMSIILFAICLDTRPCVAISIGRAVSLSEHFTIRVEGSTHFESF